MAYATNLAAINAARKAHGESYIHMTSIIKLDGEWHVQMAQPRISEPLNSIRDEREGAFVFPRNIAALRADEEAEFAAEEQAEREEAAVEAEHRAICAPAVAAAAAFFASRASNVAVEIPEAEIDPRSLKACPCCGSEELYAGETSAIKGSSFGLIINEDLVGGCHHCDWSYDVRNMEFYKDMIAADRIANAQASEQQLPNGKVWVRQSSVLKPTKMVWAIADEMNAAAREAGKEAPSRKEVQEECVRRGIASGTARTQYQAWKAAQDATAKNAALAAELSAKLNGKA